MLKKIGIVLVTYIMIICTATIGIYAISENEIFDYTIDNGKVTITGYRGSEKTIEIPATIEEYPVTEISQSAFSGVEGFIVDSENQVFSSKNGVLYKGNCLYIYPQNKKDEILEVPEGITAIGFKAFSDFLTYGYGNEYIKEIVLPDTVKIINDFAFSGCSKLESITMPSVTEVEYKAFFNCSSLKNIKMPNIEYLDRGVFESCTSLEKISLPESLKILRGSAFDSCTSLRDVELPDSVDMSGYSTFKDCLKLESVKLPKFLERIPSNTFENCTSLKTINIPEFVKYIDDKALAGCSALEFIKYSKTSKITHLYNSVFENCTSLTEVIIPDSLVYIGNHAFSGCSNLQKVLIPESVTIFGLGFPVYDPIPKPFMGCTNLTLYVYENSKALEYIPTWDIPHVIVKSEIDESTNIIVDTGTVSNIDDNAELKVEKILSGKDYNFVNEVLDQFDMYDISFVKDSQSIEIDGTAIVKIPVNDMDGTKCKVYYYDNGTYTDMNAKYEDGYMVFMTNHFSKYVVTEEEPGMLGDVNNDGIIDYLDAVTVLKYDSGDINLTELQLSMADVNNDGIVDYNDAVQILKYDAEIIDKF